MPYKEKTTTSGNYVEVERYTSTIFERPKERARLDRKSSKEQEKINNENAKKKVTRLMNCNFTTDDIFATITFNKKVKDLVELIKIFRNFKERLKYYRKKKNMDNLKYIVVYGEDNRDGLHIHMVTNNIDWEEFKKIARKNDIADRIQLSTLRFANENGLAGLGRYFIENANELKAKQVDKIGEKAFSKLVYKKFSCSKGLKKPIVKYRWLKRFVIHEIPKIPKKYMKDYTMVTFDNVPTDYGVYQYILLVKNKRSDDT